MPLYSKSAKSTSSGVSWSYKSTASYYLRHADQFVTDLHTALAKNMTGDMREQSEEMMHYFYQLNHKLDVLKEGITRCIV
jgi:hypothetical protein